MSEDNELTEEEIIRSEEIDDVEIYEGPPDFSAPQEDEHHVQDNEGDPDAPQPDLDVEDDEDEEDEDA